VKTIDERRRALGWTIAELARRAQVSTYRANQACTGTAPQDVHEHVEQALSKAEAPVKLTLKGGHPTLRDLALHREGKPHKHGAITVKSPRPNAD
jgi:transcriptional regulator with XRE-family HTH domain